MKQNITLSLEKDLLRKARILAAKKSTSISRLIADELATIVQAHANGIVYTIEGTGETPRNL